MSDRSSSSEFDQPPPIVVSNPPEDKQKRIDRIALQAKQRQSRRCLFGVCAAIILLAVALGVFFGLFYTYTSPNGVVTNCKSGVNSPVAFVAARGRAGALLFMDRNCSSVSLRPVLLHEHIDEAVVIQECVFALDAFHGRLQSFRLVDEAFLPVDNVPVDVGPFGGIDAKAGSLVVAKGDSGFSYHDYDTSTCRIDTGVHINPSAMLTAFFDVAMHPDGLSAFMSVAVASDAEYGVAVFRKGLDKPDEVITIPGAGLTAGATRPANFPLSVVVVQPANGTTVSLMSGGRIVRGQVTGRASVTCTFEMSDMFPTAIDARVVDGGVEVHVVGIDPPRAIHFVWTLDDACTMDRKSVMDLAPRSRPTGVGTNDWTTCFATHEPLPDIVACRDQFASDPQP